jgi:two-component system, CitB family, sensor kinase
MRLSFPTLRSKSSIATQVLLMQAVLVISLVGAGSTVAILEARNAADSSTRHQVLGMAEAFAEAPGTAAAVESPDPTQQLEPLTESLQSEAGVDFVVVMNTKGIRFTHPNPKMIGQEFIGHTAPALAGQPFTETYAGTLGPSIRSVVPIRDAHGRIVGLVSVGITTERVTNVLKRHIPGIIGLTALALAVSSLGALAVGRRVRRQTMGLGPVHLAELYEHHEAVMHAMREGLLILGTDGRLILANDEAVRLLDLPVRHTGLRPSELKVDGSLGSALAEGREVHDEIHLTDTRVLTVNQTVATRRGKALGTVVTLRDSTDLQALTDELASVRGFAEALRASNHEAANRLHTVVTLIELDRSDDAVRFATTELTTHQELVDRIMAAVEEPVLAALLLGKVTQARERGVELTVSDTTVVRALPFSVTDAVTLVGNLIDNAVEAVSALGPDECKQVSVDVWDDDLGLSVRVTDNGPGIPPSLRNEVFTRGFTTKASPGHGLGLALVDQIVKRHDGARAVESAPSGGALVEVMIPRRTAVRS